MNQAPSEIIRSIDQKPSVADFYAIESEFKAVESEYNSLLSQIGNTCLGATTSTRDCIKAEELNLRMQAFLVMLADILSEMRPIGEEYQGELASQKSEIDRYVIKLTEQNAKIVVGLERCKPVNKQDG